MVTLPYLRKRLHYDPKTGKWKWLIPPVTLPPKNRGKTGCRVSDGYKIIGIGQERYLAHRLAFLYMTGKLPPKNMEVDHINGIRSDDRFLNLRIVTKAQNRQNRHGISNETGYRGVQKNHGKFLASVSVGTFNTAKQADRARKRALKILFPERFT